MSFRDVVRVLTRWRRVVVVALLAAVLAGGAAYTVTPPSYTQSESYLLLYPVQTGDGAGNPFLQLGNGVGLAASVLATKLSAPDTVGRVTAGTPGLAYTVAPSITTTAPILVVTVDGDDRAAVATGLDRVGDELQTQLTDLQQATGAPEASFVTTTRLTRDPAATASRKAGVQKGGEALVGILLLGLLLVLALERRSRSRAARAASEQVDVATGATALPGDERIATLTSAPAVPVSTSATAGEPRRAVPPGAVAVAPRPTTAERPVVPSGDR